VRRDAWHVLVRRLVEWPEDSLSGLLGELGLDGEPPGWRAMVGRWLAAAAAEAYDGDRERLLRHATGRAMDALRGRVPAPEVLAAVRASLEVAR